MSICAEFSFNTNPDFKENSNKLRVIRIYCQMWNIKMKTDKPRNAMPCLKKCVQAIPSALLVALIFWTYYTYLVEFCILELKSYSTRQMIYLIIGNIFFLMFIWCYFHVMLCRGNYRIPTEFKLSPLLGLRKVCSQDGSSLSLDQ